MLPSERRAFVRTHRTCVFGTARRADGPAMSIVYYVPTDDDELLVSTMRDRAKAKAVARLGKVSLCVLDERWPFSYLQVYCDAVLDTDFDSVVDVMMRIAGVMAGTPMSEDVRPMVVEGARQEKRVALRLRPYATFYTPPRHVHSEADVGPGESSERLRIRYMSAEVRLRVGQPEPPCMSTVPCGVSSKLVALDHRSDVLLSPVRLAA